MELKKPHPPRMVVRAQMQNRLVPHPRVVDKNSGGISQEQGLLAPPQGPSAQVSSARKKSPHYFWMQKPVGTELVEETSRVPGSSS